MAIFRAITPPEEITPGYKCPRQLEINLKYRTDKNGFVQYECATKAPILRTQYITALNADANDFVMSCQRVSAQFGATKRKNSVQYKHYVQGFHPEDNERMDRETCHRLGVEMAQTVWKGFPVLVVSHFDQETENGEYHWHNHFVVWNCNIHSGKRLDTSAAAMWEQKRFVAAQAEANGLVRKGLILQHGRILESQQGNWKTSDEWREAQNLKKQAHEAALEQVRRHNVLTQKAELRLAIRAAASQTTSFEEFRRYLKDVYDVETKETRGVISYLHPDRTDRGRGIGWIRGRSLGSAYEKEAIINAINMPPSQNSKENESDSEKIDRLIELYREIFLEPSQEPKNDE